MLGTLLMAAVVAVPAFTGGVLSTLVVVRRRGSSTGTGPEAVVAPQPPVLSSADAIPAAGTAPVRTAATERPLAPADLRRRRAREAAEIARYRTDLDAVPFDPGAPDPDPAVLAQYRRAATALARAVRAAGEPVASGSSTVGRPLGEGYGALFRLGQLIGEAAEISTAIADYRAQLDAVPANPEAPDADPAVVAEYREAIAALSRAVKVRQGTGKTRLNRVLAEIRTGRAALVRLDGRLNAPASPVDAVPSDAPPPEPAVDGRGGS
ncbi:hypothetical protein [Kitasatospora kazusensis]|uniref:hypothetical protein n=1 Tax=Kitasatospora kazusensis TaxID=407974 RepID=UPI0031D91348